MAHRGFRDLSTAATPFHPRLIGAHGAIAANSYLAVSAGMDLLKAGANAVDAAVAATLVEGVVNPQMHSLGGECPMLIAPAGASAVYAVNGNTAAPDRATSAEYRRRGLKDVPDEGILAAGVPAAFGALLTALSRFGTAAFSEVVSPALALARDGFPVSVGLRRQHKFGLVDLAERFARWPASARLYMPDGPSSECCRAEETAQDDALAIPRLSRSATVDVLRNHVGGPAGSMATAVLPQSSAVRHEHPRGHRGASDVLGALPRLLCPPRLRAATPPRRAASGRRGG